MATEVLNWPLEAEMITQLRSDMQPEQHAGEHFEPFCSFVKRAREQNGLIFMLRLAPDDHTTYQRFL